MRRTGRSGVAHAARLAELRAVPKLVINAETGAAPTGAQRELCPTGPNRIKIILPGMHFIQEDSGQVMGRAIAT